ncbi:MAG: diphosphate--fructose-6-phosphate 1-phosphotransferase, partial [Lentisphaerae bacterium]|nr:diphosphate--fructose-6-phosphate 1-phosphotransferase [Lentisphaerota bacterium]
ACADQPDDFGKIFGAWHGIEGVLKEELLDLSAQDPAEMRLLGTTPAAGAIGTCRYKLRDQYPADFERIVEVFRAHDVGFFFYIGGNDSMDTADKISRWAGAAGLDMVAVGVPKTIDNDVGDSAFQLIDHTPGYGSAARFWACCIQNANEENAGACTSDPVLVLQIMGRKIGFIPAAARLADPQRAMPLQIYLPESGLTLDDLTDNVADELRRSGRCIVAISEGFEVGDLGAARDAFGHIEYDACRTSVQQVVVNHLNAARLPARGFARGQNPGTDQRSSMLCASPVDLAEARAVGRHAVTIARTAGSGWMATILRNPGAEYNVRYDQVPLRAVANSEREFPAHWLARSRMDVTDDFVRYARPLIGDTMVQVPMENGLPRFARLRPVFAVRRCADYLPAAHGV